MKRQIFIILLFFVSLASAQSTRIEISNLTRDSRFEDKRCDDTFILKAFLKGKTPEEFLVYREGYEDVNNPNQAYIINGIVTKIEVFMRAHDARQVIDWGGVSNSCGSGSVIENTEIIIINPNPCQIGSFDYSHRNGGDFEVSQSLSFDYKIIPLPKLTRDRTTEIAGYDDELKVNANVDYNSSVYNWQYGFLVREYIRNSFECRMNPNGNGCRIQEFEWFDLPNPNNPSVTVIPSTFLPKSKIGQKVFFRVSACDNNNSEDPVYYIIRKSAPRVISYEAFDISCYDSVGIDGKGDGSLRLTFDRPLEPGDSFNLAVTDKSREAGTDADNFTVYETVESYENISFDSNKSIILDGLPNSTDQGFGIGIISGDYNGEPYYSDGTNHNITFFIERPSAVSIKSIITVDDFCNDGDDDPNNNNDGSIIIEAGGGNPGTYQYSYRKRGGVFSAFEDFNSVDKHILRGLGKGVYDVKIQKLVNNRGRIVPCIGHKISESGIITSDVDIKEVEIREPGARVSVDVVKVNEPTAYGFEDGRIRATISGGTPLQDGSYHIEWKDQDKRVVNTYNSTYDSNSKNFVVTLHSIGKGNYTINVKDNNYELASNTVGCTTISESFSLDEPDPLGVDIEILNTISCNNDNEYSNGADFEQPLGQPDQFQDGILIATVTGGVPFDTTTFPQANDCRENRTQYCYSWQKQNPDGSWSSVGNNDRIIRNRSTGTFALNIEDYNGIQLGTYEPYQLPDGSREYRLQTAIDSTQFLDQPDKLEVDFVKTNISCANGNDAMAEALVMGGTPPYTYRWSTGADTKSAANLIAGTYLVYIEDAKGCQLEGSVVIEQPNGLEILPVEVVAPTCYQGNDGLLNVQVTGGTPPYEYEWSTGETSLSRNNLSADTYRMQVKDAEGCLAFKDFMLEDPLPVVVNLESARSLCGGQSVVLDITIDDPNANYQWEASNGFKSSLPQVEISERGIYTATITSGLGCIGTSDITIETFNTAIDADFLFTTQAYVDEEIILVNVSEPIGDRVEWTIPETAEVISKTDEQLILRFETEGPYDVNLRSYQSDCYQDFSKTILVQPAIENIDAFAAQGNFIEEFIVYPNPNPGTFKAKISLAEASNITVKIVNLISGTVMNERTEKNQQEFLLNYEMGLPTGIYLMLLETPKGSETRKLVFE